MFPKRPQWVSSYFSLLVLGFRSLPKIADDDMEAVFCALDDSGDFRVGPYTFLSSFQNWYLSHVSASCSSETHILHYGLQIDRVEFNDLCNAISLKFDKADEVLISYNPLL